MKVHIPWISLLLIFISYILASGIYLTINRITYYPIFKSDFLSIILIILSSALLAFYDHKKYVFLIPVSLLSFFYPYVIQSISAILILLFEITRRKQYPSSLLLLLLIILDSSMISWILIRLIFNINTYLSIPLMIFQIGLPTIIPIVWFIGIIFALIPHKKTNNNAININPILPFIVVLCISLLPYLPSLNPSKIPETVDFRYYFSWLMNPQFSGWFFDTRPFYLIFLLILSFLFKPYLTTFYQFVFLSLLYTFSAYKLSSSIDKSIAPLSSLLAVVSPMLITFLYSGLDANLFSISLMFLSMSYLIKREKLGLAMLLSFLAMLSHIYAWAQLAGGILIYYAFRRIMKKYNLDKYEKIYISTILPFLSFGLIMIFIGKFPVPFSLNILNYNQLIYQIAVVSWGSNNALLYFLISALGNRYLKNEMVNILYIISVIGTLFIGSATNLIIDLPLFIPLAYALKNFRYDLSVLLMLAFILWGIYMSINSVPLLY
ncbi:hypothetical protein BFU36_09950 [Sulfolobus sp. A20]|nr:hypothetical protein BFU36_09950 [Sulfolobus sp. A20]